MHPVLVGKQLGVRQGPAHRLGTHERERDALSEVMVWVAGHADRQVPLSSTFGGVHCAHTRPPSVTKQRAQLATRQGCTASDIHTYMHSMIHTHTRRIFT